MGVNKKRGSINKTRKKKCKICIIGLIFFVLVLFYFLYAKTGFLQFSQINDRDLQYWDYSMAGTIAGAEGYFFQGEKDVCWLMVHGYSSTPDDLRKLAESVNNEFGDYVYVPRLKGHGTKPGDLLNLSFKDWKEQVSKEYLYLENKCDKINLVGFSFGSVLVLDFLQNQNRNKVKRVYLISPFLKLRYKWWNIFNKELFIKGFSNIVLYTKKFEIGQINSPKGLDNFIAYWNMPLTPIKNSLKDINRVIKSLHKINNPILIQQSKNDDTIDIKSSKMVYNKISTPEDKKQLVIFDKSNHVLLKDYDRDNVIRNILNFEQNFK